MKENRRHRTTAKKHSRHNAPPSEQNSHGKTTQGRPGKKHGEPSQGTSQEKDPKQRRRRRMKGRKVFGKHRHARVHNVSHGSLRRLRRRARIRMRVKAHKGMTMFKNWKQGVAMHLSYIEQELDNAKTRWPTLTVLGASVLGVKAIAKFGVKKVAIASVLAYLAAKWVEAKTQKSHKHQKSHKNQKTHKHLRTKKHYHRY